MTPFEPQSIVLSLGWDANGDEIGSIEPIFNNQQ